MSRVRGPLAPILAAALLLFVLPADAHAWGPGAHVYLGSEVLKYLGLLGPAAAALLSTRPRAFLYGMLAPDLLVAKDRAPEDLHSHRWERADELLGAAGDDADRAAAVLGYRAHLAADVVAHGFFLPRRMLLTASTRAIGHSYWEHRVEAELPDGHAERARRLVLDHAGGPVEGMFRDVLTPTVFDFETNRRIYGEMVRWSNHQGWQTLFGRLVDRSRWSLDDGERRRALALSLTLCMEALRDGGALFGRSDGSGERERRLRALDPTGRSAMERAKELRRSALRAGSWDGRWAPTENLRRAADRRFPLPAVRGPVDPRALDRLLEAAGERQADGRAAA